MVHSFNKVGMEGDLFIAYEDGIKIPKIDNRILFDMDNDPFLLSWLKENEDIIPQKYGGKVPLCDKRCPDPNNNWKGHREGCLNGRYHSRVSHWFRKIVAMKVAMKKYAENYDIVVWCDCDIVFKERLPASFIAEVLGDYGAFYFMGPHRKSVKSGVESGFIAFSKANGGYKFIETIIDKYEDGSFRDYSRRDDSHLFEKVFNEVSVSSLDLVTHSRKGTDVMQESIFHTYFDHHKGEHWKRFDV
jgi:hypothetical protein